VVEGRGDIDSLERAVQVWARDDGPAQWHRITDLLLDLGEIVRPAPSEGPGDVALQPASRPVDGEDEAIRRGAENVTL
jgi:hypothetical protein